MFKIFFILKINFITYKQKLLMMFCGFCGNKQQQKTQIQVRDPYDVYRSLRVSQRNPNQILEAITKLGVFNTVIPSKFNEYLAECKKSGKKFTDKQFPPNQKSLNYFVNNRKIGWKRIKQFIKNPVLVEGSIQSSDVQQGNLGDCYFLASIASIADVPERVSKIFCGELEFRQEGIYRLQVSVNGEYKQIVIDDYIPVYQGSSRPVFCKPIGNQIWVVLLEKAWAKLNGSYGNISAGHPHQVLNTFSIGPCFYFQIPHSLHKQNEQKQKIWKDLQQATKYKLPVCAGSKQAYTCKGIKPAHTYSVLRVAKTTYDANQPPIPLLTLRNPWGDSQYTGKYSQHDTQFWSKVDGISKSRIKQENDGIFTIQYDEFLRNFQSLDICHDRIDYSNLFRKTQAQSMKPVFFQLHVQQSSDHYFYISVEKGVDRNNYIKNRKKYFGYLRLIVVRKKIQQIENGLYQSYEYVTSALQTNFLDLNHRIDRLSPGEYIIMIQSEFPEQRSGELCLNVYSKDIVLNISKLQLNDSNFLNRVFTNHAHSLPQSQRTLLSDSVEDWTASPFLFKQGGYGYLIVCLGPNTNQKIQISCNIRRIRQSGFRILNTQFSNEEGIISTIVDRGEQILIVFGLDFSKNFNQVIFPPKGIKLMKII